MVQSVSHSPKPLSAPAPGLSLPLSIAVCLLGAVFELGALENQSCPWLPGVGGGGGAAEYDSNNRNFTRASFSEQSHQT